MIHKNIIGLDISDTHIKVVQLDEKKRVVSYGDFELPTEVVSEGLIVDCDAFIEKCIYILKHTKPIAVQGDFTKPHAIISLPEDKVWSHTMVVPDTIHPEAVGSYIQTEAAKLIPFDFATLYTSYALSTIRGSQYATFVGAQKEVVDQYRSCLSKVDIEIDFIGSNFYSIARSVLPESFGEDNYIIIDIGNRRTTIGAFDENAIAYVALQNIVSKHEVDDALATISVDGQESDGTNINKVLSSIVDDVQHVIKDFTKQTGQNLTKILVTGQLANSSRFVTCLQKSVIPDVSLGNAYHRIQNTEIFGTGTTSVSFANVIGLALYGIDRTMPHINLLSEEDSGAIRGRLSFNPTFLSFNVVKITKNLLHRFMDEYMQKNSKGALVGAVVFVLAMLFILGYVTKHYLL